MEGPAAEEAYAERGIVPRAVEQLWDSVQSQLQTSHDIKITVVEIYNEELLDVLGFSNEGLSSADRKVCLMEHESTVELRNATEVQITSKAQLSDIVEHVRMHRATASTVFNARSSRSHVVYRVDVRACGEEGAGQGRLNLIDLAGSETEEETGGDDARRREAACIKSSLVGLETVFLELAAGEYVPFRRSKLTLLLKNSLEGRGKVLFIVNISPRAEDISETMKSLHFATSVSTCTPDC
ncbi:hypothetical protein V5799_024010 [Amblyomma americanum]|uniref:Kinesin motor domain-containing protein n=1 Tax=Amblyomma americanum TaxID=6943 RepID=A0AAQ4EDC3_AMBAM